MEAKDKQFAVLFIFLQLCTSKVASFIHCPQCTSVGNVVECFESSQVCAESQICAGTVENFHITVECGFDQVCQAELLLDRTNCTGGLPFHHTDRCHFCCHDVDSCRHTMELVQKGIDGTHEVLHCPTCPEGTTEPLQCLSDMQPCDPGVKVCSIAWSGTKVEAGCEPNAVLCHLKESQSQEACVEERLHEDAFCTRCCTNQTCWLDAFFIPTTTTPAATPASTTATTPPTTTPTPSLTTPTPESPTTSLPVATTPQAATTASTTATTPPTTTPTPSLTTPTPESPTTSLPVATTPQAVSTSAAELPCINHVIYDFHCNAIPGICAGPGARACQKQCGLCHYVGASEPPLQSPSSSCYDRVGSRMACSDLPGVCTDETTRQVLCPSFCGICGAREINEQTTLPPLTTTARSRTGCQDNVAEDQCHLMMLQGVCQNHVASMLCAKTCGYCAA